MNYLELLFPDFALIVLGYVLCRFTPINRSVWQPVEQLVYYLLFPVLLFHSITRNPSNGARPASCWPLACWEACWVLR